MANGAHNSEYVFSESDRRHLFLDALSKPVETAIATYAFEAVSKAFFASPIWSQWMGTALHDLDDFTECNIDKLIDLNQALGQRGSVAPYLHLKHGGWSVTHAPLFMGERDDLHLGYVVDGAGVGYAMIFPKNPNAWLSADHMSSSCLDYTLWGNSDRILRISLRLWFDASQDHRAYVARFDSEASRLLPAAIPGEFGQRILNEFEKAKPFNLQIGSLDATFATQIGGERGEKQRLYELCLRHVDRRSRVIRKMDSVFDKRIQPPPTRNGGWMGQRSRLRLSLLKLGL